MRFLLPLLIALPVPSLGLTCTGTNPPWSVTMTGEEAVLTLANAQKPYAVRLATTALNDDATVAYTLIGDRDTAIVIVYPATCNTQAHAAHLLTQQNESPILTTGCCIVDD